MRPEPEIAIEGIGALHRVDDGDCARVLAWRNAPAVRAAMYTTHEIASREHELWWAAMLADRAQLYCIADAPDGPLGVVGITRLDAGRGEAHWAFYASPEAPRGAGSRMEALALELAFGPLGLTRLHCEVREENERVRGLHARFGFEPAGALTRETPNGPVSAVCLELGADDWRARRGALLAALGCSGDAK